MTVKIGADVVYVWGDETDELRGYISFGTWEDDADFDSYGVPDLEVFFYSSEEELPLLMAAGPDSLNTSLIRLTNTVAESFI